jgi:putative hydrolase of the HAD superfamily
MTVSPTLIFDVGGVLVRHDNELLFDRLAACCVDPTAARPQLNAALHDKSFGRGQLGIDVLHARLVKDYSFAENYAHFLELWSSHFSAEPGMDSVLPALARRYRTVLFSNTNAPHWAHVMANYPVLGAAHAIYVSHELGLVKPDAVSFQRVLGLERCRAQDSIFIDDRADNIGAAGALGIRTVMFTGYVDLLTALRGYGVAVDL